MSRGDGFTVNNNDKNESGESMRGESLTEITMEVPDRNGLLVDVFACLKVGSW
jgi:hypothetical protein